MKEKTNFSTVAFLFFFPTYRILKKELVYSKWFDPRSISSWYCVIQLCDRPGEVSSEKNCC